MANKADSDIGARRGRRGLSQSDLARAAGVSRQAIGAIESGTVQPGVKVALALARALGTTVEELFSAPPRGLEAEVPVPTGTGTRVAVASIGGRIVARSLDPREGAFAEPAHALVMSSSNGVAQLEPLVDETQLESTIFLAGCDPALGLLSAHVNASAGRAVWFATSNRDAVSDLIAHRVHVAALHGSNQELDRLLGRVDAPLDVYELAATEEGWIVAPGNPKKLRGARDLSRAGVRLANRAPGSAARGLLEGELRRAGLTANSVAGYRLALSGHVDVARTIALGFADIGIGVAGVADAFKLAFIPLRQERCVLAMHRNDRGHAGVAAFVSALRSTAFRRDLSSFGPYDTARLGECVETA
jgi:putative molybdopterin biosynthesis protein